MIKRIAFILLFFQSVAAFAQFDSVPYSRDFEFREGFFQTVYHLKNNEPIPKASIISGYPKSQPDFMTQVMQAKYITYKDRDGIEQKVLTSTLWGFCQNRTIYINYNGEFSRLNVIGTLCHFIAKKYTPVGYTDPMNYNYGINTSDEQHQFVLDTQADRIYDFTVSTMEMLLASDPQLSAEFMLIKRRKRQDFIFVYLRKFNEKHPLYISVK